MLAARFSMIVLLVAALGLAVSGAGEEKPGKSAAKPRSDPGKQAKPVIRAQTDSDVETAIRASAARFSEAYNSHDAKAVAAGFTTGAEFITENGTILRGREALERHFAAVFRESPKVHLELKVDAVRKLAAVAALEEGTVKMIRAPDESPIESRYLAVHVRDEGGWLVALARDEAARYAGLDELDWLLGDWMDESEGALILTSCRRAAEGDHLLQEFTIRRPSETAASGTTRIARDPQTGQIRSWTFDSRGGRSEALWSRAPGKNAWVLKSQGVNAAGKVFSATAVLRKIDGDTMTWESRDRVEGGMLSPDFGPVTVNRRPPAPGE